MLENLLGLLTSDSKPLSIAFLFLSLVLLTVIMSFLFYWLILFI